jgi:hypothetical protein
MSTEVEVSACTGTPRTLSLIMRFVRHVARSMQEYNIHHVEPLVRLRCSLRDPIHCDFIASAFSATQLPISANFPVSPPVCRYERGSTSTGLFFSRRTFLSSSLAPRTCSTCFCRSSRAFLAYATQPPPNRRVILDVHEIAAGCGARSGQPDQAPI